MGEIFTKVQESRLKWYGHELRREEEYAVKRVTEVPLVGLIISETQYRVQWRRLIRNIDPT